MMVLDLCCCCLNVGRQCNLSQCRLLPWRIQAAHGNPAYSVLNLPTVDLDQRCLRFVHVQLSKSWLRREKFAMGIVSGKTAPEILNMIHAALEQLDCA